MIFRIAYIVVLSLNNLFSFGQTVSFEKHYDTLGCYGTWLAFSDRLKMEFLS